MYFKLNERRGVERRWYVMDYDKTLYGEYGAVADAPHLNRVRQILATLLRHNVSPWNLVVMRGEQGGFRILARCCNHLSYLPSYCGGILFAVDRRRRKGKRRRTRPHGFTRGIYR